MAKIILKHDPVLTVEALKQALSYHFINQGYEVGISKLIGADIYIKKNNWVGVAIKLKQKPDSTFLRINGFVPNVALRVLVNGLIPLLFLWPKWKRLIAEVRSFTENEFINSDSVLY
jgi:hypothetical protein